jgi:hypothetical protein
MLHLSRHDPAPTSLAIADTPACMPKPASTARIPGTTSTARLLVVATLPTSGAPHITNTHRIFLDSTPCNCSILQDMHYLHIRYARLQHCTTAPTLPTGWPQEIRSLVSKLLVSRWLRVSSDIIADTRGILHLI